MQYEELVEVFKNESDFIGKYESHFRYGDFPGGTVLYGHQEYVVDRDVKLKVVCHHPSPNGWYNEIDIVPTSRRAKAARIAVRKSQVPNVSSEIFDRSIKTRFGWEIVQGLNDFYEELRSMISIRSRPNLNKYGCLSTKSFVCWLKVNDIESDWLFNLSGPRQIALLKVLYGDDWRNRPTEDDLLKRDIYRYKIGN